LLRSVVAATTPWRDDHSRLRMVKGCNLRMISRWLGTIISGQWNFLQANDVGGK
jgi:hypothetical protein